MPAEIDQDLPPDDLPVISEPRARTRTRIKTEPAVLTPGAGEGLGRLVGERLLLRTAFIDDLIAAYGNSLKATTRCWDKEAIAADGSPGKWRYDPDFKVRLAAANSVMAHLVGEPIKRVIHQHLDGNPAGETGTAEQKLVQSPAVLEAAQRLIDRARRARAAEST